ncbi:hypothetical protein GmHk_11G032838 [Glycine max]|nr:hypothetical protein GmHk_11G032838 [Glycine max]
MGKYPFPADIDNIISAEILDVIEQPQLYECKRRTPLMKKIQGLQAPHGATSHMMHGLCGNANRKLPCMKDGKRNDGKYIEKNHIALDNRYVVPYNPNLLLKYQDYLNIEWCNQSTSIKYLFKCIIVALVPMQNDDGTTGQCLDELKHYIHKKSPAIEGLYFHLPGENSIIFEDDDGIDALLSKPIVKDSMFTSWLQANSIYNEGKHLKYVKFITKFAYVPPSTGELYYLRMMLVVVIGPTIHEEICIVNDQLYASFRKACFAMGFLLDDKEYIKALREAFHWDSRKFLTILFVTMLISKSIERPKHVWSETWEYLIDGILHDQSRITNIPNLELAIAELHNYDKVQLERDFQAYFASLIETIKMHIMSKHIFNSWLGEFFSYIGKTLASTLCSKGDIVLTIASSGIASLLLPNDIAAHTNFVILVPTLENSTCNIYQALDKTPKDITCMSHVDSVPFGGKVVFGGDFRKILPMIPRGSRSDIVHATINASYLRDYYTVLKVDKKYVLASQLNNVKCRKNKKLFLVAYCRTLSQKSLTCAKRMNKATYLSLKSDFVKRVWTGIQSFACLGFLERERKLGAGNDGFFEIEIPFEFLITNFSDPIKSIVTHIYQNIQHNYKNEDFLKSRAILASNIEAVEQINEYVLNIVPGDDKEYLSCDSIDMTDSAEIQGYQAITLEFLHSLKTSRLPNHKIRLKIGTPIMLIRN